MPLCSVGFPSLRDTLDMYIEKVVVSYAMDNNR